jgi:metal-responsive CopG/Arc/MetJ family transcriptional regulator
MVKRAPRVARVVVGVSLPMPMWVELDRLRAERDRPIADILREACRFYLESLAPEASASGE